MSRLHDALTAIGRSAPRVLARSEPPPALLPRPRARRRPTVPLLCAVSLVGAVGAATWLNPLLRVGREGPPAPSARAAAPSSAAPVREDHARETPAGANLRSRARLAATLGALDEARDLLKQALRLDRNDAAAWNDLGVVLVLRGDRRRGVEALERSLQLDGGRADTHRNLAVALEQVGDRIKAAGHYRAFVALAPGHPERAQVERRLASSVPREGAR